LTVWAGPSQPATSNINWLAGQTTSNNFTCLVGNLHNDFAVSCGGGPTDVIIDIFGYYP
jgi:hypothetical protein